MKIAFDAKRAYQNETGLGNYSRTLVSSLASFYPHHQYYLCAPKITDRYNASHFPNIHNITPDNFFSSVLKAAWRSSWVKKDLLANKIDLYHGLSHEIPFGINQTGIKSVVTIHDLIFERYPKQYNSLDVQIYRSKFKYASTHANRVVAISQQTKDDIIRFYKIPEEKINICYQSCDPAFAVEVSEEGKMRVKEILGLPDRFFLYVGSIIERKNLLNICKALHQTKNKINIPLVVIGNGSKYKQQVQQYLKEKDLQKEVIFLSDSILKSNKSFQSFQAANDHTESSQSSQPTIHFPAVYQQALAMIYPSVFEGFGIPILEALCSRLPVITSNLSCMPETGGDAALYVDPYSVSAIANAMLEISANDTLRRQMKEKGWQHAQKFTPEKGAADVMQVYLRL
jgi:glycosyltransferase involved in cell wall biosynthesis